MCQAPRGCISGQDIIEGTPCSVLPAPCSHDFLDDLGNPLNSRLKSRGILLLFERRKKLLVENPPGQSIGQNRDPEGGVQLPRRTLDDTLHGTSSPRRSVGE